MEVVGGCGSTMLSALAMKTIFISVSLPVLDISEGAHLKMQLE